MALSDTSNTMWCRPEPSSVSPIYMPGRFRTASKPFKTLMDSAPYSPALAVSPNAISLCADQSAPAPPHIGGGAGNCTEKFWVGSGHPDRAAAPPNDWQGVG